MGKKKGSDGSKNPYYDLLVNKNINWRIIAHLFFDVIYVQSFKI